MIQSNKPKFTAKQLTTVAVSFPGSGSINSSSFSFVVSRAQAFLNTCLKKTRIKNATNYGNHNHCGATGRGFELLAEKHSGS